jgi:3D (Asp-Asp-Asp) domain-containing protein
MQAVYMTFYGWPDNSPPGNAIAYPMNGGFPTIHDGAGGAGTFDDPITFATDKAEFPVGTVLYAAVLDKYLIMEDDCVECDSDWSGSMKWHIDVWMNSNATANANAVQACEDRWTQNSTIVEVSPPAGRQVTTPPLFDTTANACRTSP